MKNLVGQRKIFLLSLCRFSVVICPGGRVSLFPCSFVEPMKGENIVSPFEEAAKEMYLSSTEDLVSTLGNGSGFRKRSFGSVCSSGTTDNPSIWRRRSFSSRSDAFSFCSPSNSFCKGLVSSWFFEDRQFTPLPTVYIRARRVGIDPKEITKVLIHQVDVVTVS